MTPSLVLDGSVAMAWCFQNEATPATAELLDRMASEGAAVPAWWYLEVANVLALAERRQRITAAQVAGFIALLDTFDLVVDDQAPQRVFTALLPLCRSHGLSSYDAAYLDLALRRRLPLATLDQQLTHAATALSIEVLGR